MTIKRTDLQPGDRVCVFPGLRKHNPHVRIPPGDVCTVVKLPGDGQPADAVAILVPSGEVVWVDADLVGRMN